MKREASKNAKFKNNLMMNDIDNYYDTYLPCLKMLAKEDPPKIDTVMSAFTS